MTGYYASLAKLIVAGSLVIAGQAGVGVAEELPSSTNGFALPLGASYGYGQLKGSGLGISARTMDSLSLAAMPAYRFGDLAVGLDLRYDYEGQLTSVGT